MIEESDGWNCVWDLIKFLIIVFFLKKHFIFCYQDGAVKMKGCSGEECFLDLI
jgi:hypothetical protein